MNDQLKQQIDEWNDADLHQDIINSLEQIPEAIRDYEAVGLLARAYNNVGQYAKATQLLESVRKDGEGDGLWNFRMGYAHYYLDNTRDALYYFTKARKLNPEDENARYFMYQCNLEMPFAQRVEKFWNWFEEHETKLSEMIHPNTQEELDEFMEFINDGTRLISENIHFNIGGDYEFTFSVEGWPDLFILYPYIISRMPESLKGKWKFFPFNQGKEHSFTFRMYDTDIDIDQIMVKASYQEESNAFNMTYYEKNLCTLPVEQGNNTFQIVLELMLGEGISFKYINQIDRSAKFEEGMIALPDLRPYLEEAVKSRDLQFYENPKDMYTAYQLTPKESEELRFDVIVGSTCLESIVTDYYNDSCDLFDHINSFGAQAIYITYQNDENNENDIVHFRHDIEDRISEEILEPMNLGLVIGGATGTDCSYIDLLVYDLPAFIKKIRPLLKEYPSYTFYLSDFVRHAEIYKLTEMTDDNLSYTKDGAEVSVDDQRLTELEPDNDVTRDVVEECSETEEKAEGIFVGFALLTDKSWDKDKYIKDLKEQWDIEICENEEHNDDALVFSVDNMMATISLMPVPVPNDEALECAKNNFMWPEAEKVAKVHKAHLMVAVLGNEVSLIERGKLYVKLMSACCLQKNVTGIYASGVVFEPRFYEEFSGMLKKDSLPIFNWIWFGLYRTEKGISGYTYGMECFGKDEIEVLDVDAEPSDVRDFLSCMVGYVLEYDVVLNDGETIGFSAKDIHKISRSTGVALPDKMTLKISYDMECDSE